MRLSEKIGEWRHRECFAIDGTDLCIKRVKSIERSFKRLVRSILLPNPNETEYRMMESFPDELRGFVPDSVRLEKECLIMARAIDFDGTPSKTLFETGPIGDSGFWEAVDFITEVLDRERLYFFDIFYKGNNVLVKRLSETESVPLIVDFKRLGWQAYPLQPNLILESEKRRKFFRRLRRFEEAFRLENP